MTDLNKIKQIAKFTNLTHDGDKDDLRLFADGDWFVYMNIIDMGKETYEEWQKTLSETEVKGPGFTVYASSDSGGYEYHAKFEGLNYQQITVSIDNLDLALKNKDKIWDKINELDAKLSKFSSFDVEYAGVPSLEDIDNASKAV